VRLTKAKSLYNWYYNPGEILRSIGFYMNPYHQLINAKFDHVFAMDGVGNFYVGQFSTYQNHLDDIFDITKQKIEFGKIVLKENPIVILEEIEPKNIILMNRRLWRLAQRLYDYGLPIKTIIHCPNLDMFRCSDDPELDTPYQDNDFLNPSLYNILKGKPLERIAKAKLLKIIKQPKV
jgi:hypothetical protein